MEAVGVETNGFQYSGTLLLPLRELWESDPKLPQDKPGEDRTKNPAESAENVVVQRRLRRHEENGLHGDTVGVVFGHRVPPCNFLSLNEAEATCLRLG